MVKMPLYKGTPTARDYEDDYTKGWNDAMDFIFPEAKEKREKERVGKKYIHNQNKGWNEKIWKIDTYSRQRESITAENGCKDIM